MEEESVDKKTMEAAVVSKAAVPSDVEIPSGAGQAKAGGNAEEPASAQMELAFVNIPAPLVAVEAGNSSVGADVVPAGKINQEESPSPSVAPPMSASVPAMTEAAGVAVASYEAPGSAVEHQLCQATGPCAHDELRRIRKELPEIFRRAEAKVLAGELGLIGWGLSRPRVQKLDPEHDGKPWFFIGDIHGDFLALFRLLERARREQDFRLCFLGDLVDRGPASLECFALLLESAERHPHQIMWILGNHDEAVRWNGKEKKFVPGGGLSPAEFVDELNSASGWTPEEKVPWGRLFIDIAARLPRAVLFSSGLLATHGGVPLNDRWADLKNMEALHHERCLADFSWARLAALPRKMGWKSESRKWSSNFEVGHRDLEDFCKAVSHFFPVKGVVCGHQHPEAGHELRGPSAQVIPVLLLAGFGFDSLSNSVEKYRKHLLIAQAKAEVLPVVEEILYPPEEHLGCYPLKGPGPAPVGGQAV